MFAVPWRMGYGGRMENTGTDRNPGTIWAEFAARAEKLGIAFDRLGHEILAMLEQPPATHYGAETPDPYARLAAELDFFVMTGRAIVHRLSEVPLPLETRPEPEPKSPEAPPEPYDNREETARRTVLITAALHYCKDHPEVNLALRKAQVNNEPLAGHVGQMAFWYALADRYQILDEAEQVRYIAQINSGLPACERLLETGGPVTAEDHAALIDLTIAYELLCRTNLRLVGSVAEKYRGALDFPDLLQIGCAGLMRALVKRHKDDHSAPARYWKTNIQNAIRMALEVKSPFAMSSYDRRRLRELRTITAKLRKRGIEPTPKAIVDHSEKTFNLNQVYDLMTLQAGLRVDSLQEVIYESSRGGEVTHEEQLTEKFEHKVSEQQLDAEERSAKKRLVNLLKRASLTPSQLFVLGLHYNIGTDLFEQVKLPVDTTFKNVTFNYATLLEEHGQPQGLSYSEIGAILGITKGMVAVYHAKAMERLKQAIDPQVDAED